ncbi:MAG: glycosyltransferase family 4 protein [Bacteroidetes bacterium]|nr:glycosyltransferase family 4 protein [Bacteroidota bacterium]
MKHVVFITPGFAKDENDASCIPPLQLFAKHLAQQNFKVTVVALEYPEKKNYQWHLVNVYSCGGNNAIVAKPFTWLKATALLKKINQECKIDVVHSFWLQDTMLVGNYFARKYSIPYLTTMMGQDVLPSNNYLKVLSLSKQKLVALSNFHANTLNATTQKVVHKIIPWGIDKNEFPEFNAGKRTVDILAVGSLNQVKNLNEFIEVVALVKNDFPKVNAIIAGDGLLRNELEGKVKQLNLSNNINFKGHLQRPEILQLMQQSKILLHISKFESYGYVFAEALWSGMKIVSHKVGIANEQNSFIGNSTQELANNCVDVLQTVKTFTPIETTFIQQTVADYIDLYNKLLFAK